MDAATLGRRLAALPALAMRRAALREILAALDALEAARLCGQIVRHQNRPPFDAAMIALGALLDGGDLGYEGHARLYQGARDVGDEQLARLLLSAEPPPPGKPLAVPIPGIVELTLGHKKALARGRRREILDRLLRDPDETVLAVLLGNSRVTEADIVRLAARRPTTGNAQRRIFRCERFIVRYAVKRALVLNPYTPSDLAARLVPLLNRADLELIGDDSSLPSQVREAARDQLSRTG